MSDQPSTQRATPHLQRKAALYERYPHLVPWGGDLSPEGWAHIVADALEQITGIEQASGIRARLSQIKSKFGTMRCYVGADTDRIAADPLYAGFVEQVREVAQAAVRRSETACETCGRTGDLRRDGGFVFNGCEEHSRGCQVLPLGPSTG